MGRTAEQLISTILQVQAQHQQSVAAISAQYESVSQQLSELRGSLAAFFNGQAASHQAVASVCLTDPDPSRWRSLTEPQQLQQASQGYAPRPAGPLSGLGPGAPALAQQAAPPPGPPRPPPSHPTNRPSRPPPQSPQAHADNRLVQKPGAQTPQTPGPPAYDYRTVGTVEEVWKEYREGMDGQPAIEELDSTWGSRWRPEPRGRTWYSRRKVIWDKIKEYVGEGMDEQSAVKEVEKLRDGGTINKLIRMLQDERKDKGITDDSIGA